MYDGPHSLCFSSIRKKITFNENALLRDQRKKWVFLENQHYGLNIEHIFTKFIGHPRNWMISSKGQVYAKKTVDFIIKKEGSVYFEQARTIFGDHIVKIYVVHHLQQLQHT